jgi:uncharacterized membrane protein
MDLNRLTLGDKVLAGSSFALFIFSFLRWYGLDRTFGSGAFSQSVSYSENGWSYITGVIAALLALVLLAYVVITKVLEGVKLPELPVPWGLAVLGTAGLTALLVVIKLLMGASKSGVDLDRKYGIFLATLAALGVAAGGFLKFQEDGGDLKDLKKGGSTGTGTGQGGAPTPF